MPPTHALRPQRVCSHCTGCGFTLPSQPRPLGLGLRQGLRSRSPVTYAAADIPSSSGSNGSYSGSESTTSETNMENFCIIENSETVQDFANLQLTEITQSISSRRNRIFLLMEEVRRLRIQERFKGGEVTKEQELAQEQFSSALPFLPLLSEANLNSYYTFYGCFCLGIIAFGGFIAPILELKLGVGGTSYLDFVQSLRLPSQLAQVDPIVASFCGGAVGAVSSLLVVEINNVKRQQKNRCLYCGGTGYLTCGHCVGSGLDPLSRKPCNFCAGTSKVMCTSCLCTGKSLATEHDPRIDPF